MGSGGRTLACAVGVAALSCLNPTEIVLELSTNVACTENHEVAIAVGAANDEDAGFSAVGSSCTTDGGLGSLVIVPSGGIDEAVGIRVVLGVDASAETCGAQNYAGCVVARRALRFDPHTPLTLPIDLDQSCIGIPCTPDSTCVGGACVDAGVTCDGGSCVIPSDGGPPPPPPACVDTNGAVKIEGNVIAGTPTRIARTSTGWAILYEMGSSSYLYADTLVQTPTLNVSTPHGLASTASAMGGLASTPTFFAVTYGESTTTWGAFASASDGGIVGYQSPNTVPGTNGLFALDDAGTYVLAASSTLKTPLIATLDPAFGLNTFNPFSIVANVANVALAQNVTTPNDFYVTMNDASTCYAFPCTYTKGFVCMTPEQHMSCGEIRAAARGTAHATAWKSGQDILSVDQYAVGAMDAPLGLFTIVATKADYPVLYISGGALMGARYDGVAAPISSALVTNISTPITSLDAVADDPNGAGYAMALVSGTTLYFMHVCN
jgi:hypothetical protein